MIKYLSAALVASSLVLAGCSSLSDAGSSIKEGASSMGSKARDKVMGTSSETGAVAPDAAGNAAGSVHQSTDTMPHAHDAATQSAPAAGEAGSGSYMDQAKQKASEKAGEYKDKASDKIKGKFGN